MVKRLAEYFGEGSTWTRLQSVAKAPPKDGGLGLFGELSRDHVKYFGKAPGSVVDGRPASDVDFLVFVRGKEQVLRQVASRDVVDRHLAPATRAAVDQLASIEGWAMRSVSGEMVHRALFLHHWVNKHRHIARVMSLDALSRRAMDILQDTSVTDATLTRLGCDRAYLAARGWDPTTWVEAATLIEFGDADLARAAMTSVNRLHLSLAATATSLLALLIDNIQRTSWPAAAVLSPDAACARAAAHTLQNHLLTTAPQRRTAFEASFASSDACMASLEAFVAANPPVCLRQSRGAYKPLFKLLAVRLFCWGPTKCLIVSGHMPDGVGFVSCRGAFSLKQWTRSFVYCIIWNSTWQLST